MARRFLVRRWISVALVRRIEGVPWPLKSSRPAELPFPPRKKRRTRAHRLRDARGCEARRSGLAAAPWVALAGAGQASCQADCFFIGNNQIQKPVF